LESALRQYGQCIDRLLSLYLGTDLGISLWAGREILWTDL
jgi:hypothetical protein